MSTLLIDNYDSYTYNVFHLLAAASGEEPIVVHNDMVSWRALSRWDLDAIVLSPGPGRPDRRHDFGVCSDVLRFSEAPVLGVCLGHQGLGHLLKATVTTAPMAMHGRLSRVRHTGSGLFEGIPQDFSAVRYHSLAVTGSLGREGREIAWSADGVVMGIEHAHRPMWGVQFHPESISTEHGHRLLENFYRLAHARKPPRGGRPNRPSAPCRRVRKRTAAGSDIHATTGSDIHATTGSDTQAAAGSDARLHVRAFDGEANAELLFERLFGAAEHAFWLDSAEHPTQLGQCSYLGATMGEHRLVLEYDVERCVVTRHDASGTSTTDESIFQALERELEARAVDSPREPARGLAGGFVGYLGYECKADCGASNVHRSDVPDAVQMLANRIIAVDHATLRTYAIAVTAGEEPDAERWLEEAETAVREALAAPPPDVIPTSTNENPPQQQITFRVGRGREQYLADIARCKRALAAGESYEVCLTDQIHTDATPDPWLLYRGLRRGNPAPFAAYLRLGELAIVSSSPERFLSVDRDRQVMARPIKGTASRAEDPVRDEAASVALRRDEKTLAEHLMIVDLLRNDLGRVCELDTVRVPELMAIERYATVHQMVSNVVGVLKAGHTQIDCVRACFPGGSMTGAPKLRTMEIIDDIEREARGVYSGAIGWFGLDGALDLSIVIRTIVTRPRPPGGGARTTTIGAGGAIVTQSDPEEEFEEILLKARAPMAAIARAVTGDENAWTVELDTRFAEAAS